MKVARTVWSGGKAGDNIKRLPITINYNSFKHTLVFLVCASADSKTQEAYELANGDVAFYGSAIEENIRELY